YGIQAQGAIIWGNRGGMDICLSDSEDYYYGILIRIAEVVNNDSVELIPGPALLKNYVINHLNNDTINGPEITDFEANTLVLENRSESLNCSLYNLPRIGLNGNNDPLQYYNISALRTITDIRLSKGQRKCAAWNMVDKNIEATMENVYGLLGYNSNWVLNEVRGRKNN